MAADGSRRLAVDLATPDVVSSPSIFGLYHQNGDVTRGSSREGNQLYLPAIRSLTLLSIMRLLSGSESGGCSRSIKNLRLASDYIAIIQLAHNSTLP